MAIEKVAYPTSVPAAVADYQKQNGLIASLVKAIDGARRVIGGNVVQGAAFNVGGALYVATSDTAIAGVASDYVKYTPSGDTLTLIPSYVASLSGVSWNKEYKGYYDVSGNLYEVVDTDRCDRFLGEVSPGEFIIPGFGRRIPQYGAAIDAEVAVSAFGGGAMAHEGARFKIPFRGTVRVKFSVARVTASSSGYARVYKNGSDYDGTRYEGDSATDKAYKSYSKDVPVVPGDYLSVYACRDSGGDFTFVYLAGIALCWSGYGENHKPGVVS